MINKKGISLHPQSSNNDGAIAQLVEQRTENPCVPGSIPGGTTLNKQNPDFILKSGFFVLSHTSKELITQYPTQLKVKGYPCHYRPWPQLHNLITAYGCIYGLSAVCVVAKDIIKRKAYFISLAPV